MINPMEMTGRVILVTGASSGVGRATSVLLSQLGAKLVLVGRDQDRLSETLAALDGRGHTVHAFDLTRHDELPSWMKAIAREAGALSGLAHCAGIQMIRPLQMLRTEQVEQVFEINVTSSIMLAKSFRQKGVHDSGGAVIFVSSVMAEAGAKGLSAYCASKGALHALTRALALELARDRIRVNSVAPGYVETEMAEKAATVVGTDHTNEVRNMHPLGFGRPTDVAHAIAFLLADSGRWVTGSVLTVDGGYTAH
jgi:NAD(P)-dependent dehydrogenase (short-subunit alcohol dehydrogenase family)